MADYLHREALSMVGTYNASTEFLQSLAIFVLHQVKSSVEGCDDESLIATFNGIDGSFRWFTHDEVLEREEWIHDYHRAESQLFRAFLNPKVSEEELAEEVQRFGYEVKLGKKTQLSSIAKRLEMFMRWQAARQKHQEKAKTASREPVSRKPKQAQ
jgi:hypothetical protein